MRLPCEVETTYLLAQRSGEGRSKRIRASITVGKKTEEIVVIVSTTKNVAGVQYKVSVNHLYTLGFHMLVILVKVQNNIDRVFSKFICEGKATIRFINPSHDLAISKVSADNS